MHSRRFRSTSRPTLASRCPRRAGSGSRLVAVDGWLVARVAERFQCSSSTVSTEANRLRRGDPLSAKSSRPHSSPDRTPKRVERRIIALRVTRWWRPHRTAFHLRTSRSTVERVLKGPGCRGSACRSGDRVADRKAQAGPVRDVEAGGTGACRHQEARPNLRRRRLARARPRVGARSGCERRTPTREAERRAGQPPLPHPALLRRRPIQARALRDRSTTSDARPRQHSGSARRRSSRPRAPQSRP